LALRHGYGIKPTETASSQESEVVRRKSHSGHKYAKVLDGRKQPVRGLWQGNGKFIARIAIEGKAGMKSNRMGGVERRGDGCPSTGATKNTPR
jgi:hypothetical protein